MGYVKKGASKVLKMTVANGKVKKVVKEADVVNMALVIDRMMGKVEMIEYLIN